MSYVQDFIDKVKPHALDVQRNHGIPYGVAIAQAALETGWGRYVRGNNYFGIKGPGQRFATHEYINGYRVDMIDSFRMYRSLEDSFRDYGRFLTSNERYAPAFRHKEDPGQFARELHKAGYATDPKYSDKLISIMRRYGLYKPIEELLHDDDRSETAQSLNTKGQGSNGDEEPHDAILHVIGLGLMEADESGAFRPEQPITRGELAVVLQRLLALE